MATWASVKKQAAKMLGLQLEDKDVHEHPDDRRPTRTASSSRARARAAAVRRPATGLRRGQPRHPGAGAGERRCTSTRRSSATSRTTRIRRRSTRTSTRRRRRSRRRPTPITSSADSRTSRPARTTTRCSNAHFCAGDGRVNENIALSTIHQIFHSEHDRLVDYIKNILTTDTSATGAAALAEWKLPTAPSPDAVVRRAPVPGRPLRHRDGVPAPRVRGVRTQGAAGDPAVPHLPPGHQPGDPGRVRPRRLPLRALDARRRRGAPERRRRREPDRQLAAVADGVPEPAGVLQRARGRHADRRSRRRAASSWARRTRSATSSTSSSPRRCATTCSVCRSTCRRST